MVQEVKVVVGAVVEQGIKWLSTDLCHEIPTSNPVHVGLRQKFPRRV